MNMDAATPTIGVMKSGVYEIVNKVNGKSYVGSAASFTKRWNEHRRQLNNGSHHCRHLQASWKHHGAEAFQFRRLVVCSKANLLMYEQIAIDALQPEFNVERVAGSSIGCVRTPDTRAKIAAKAKGRRWTEESKAKLSATLTGRTLTAEHRAKLIGNKHAVGLKHTDEWKVANSSRNTGKKRPKDAAYRAKIAAALSGRKATPEARANQSAAQRGKKRGPYKPWSEEALENYRMAVAHRDAPMLGKKHSDEARQKMSKANRGRRLTAEDKARRAETMRAMWADPERRAAMLAARRK